MENDLADRLDDLICAFDSGFDATTGNLESIVFVLLGWIVFAFCLYIIIYRLFKTNQTIKEEVVEDELDGMKKKENVQTNELVKNIDQEKKENDKAKIEDPPVSSTKAKEDPKVKKDDGIPSAVAAEISQKLAPVSVAKPTPSTSTQSQNGSSPIANGHSETPSLPLEIPKSLGSDVEAVAWVNDGIQKGFTDPKISKELIKMWLNSLTQYTKSSGAEDGVAVQFEKIAKMPSYPKISNVITQTHPGDNMTITADLVMTSLSLKCKLIQIFSDESEDVHDVTINLDQMRGRINLSVLSRERWLIVRFDGWPEVKARLVPETKEKDRKSKEQMFKTICDVAKDLSVSAIRGAQVNINMEEFKDPNDGVSPVFPAFVRGLKKISSLSTLSSADQPLKLRPPTASGLPTIVKTPVISPKSEKPSFTHELSIRVVKAMQLGMTTPSASSVNLRPYVIVEIDEPSQRGRTDSINLADDPTGTPHWNEEFNFNLTERSGEVLFEVWDSVENEGDSSNVQSSPSPRDGFLGLGIVSIDELMITSSQRLVLPLQGRPYYSDNDGDVVNGLLMVQFDMVDMLRKKRGQKKYQRKRSDRRSLGRDTLGDSEIGDVDDIPIDPNAPGENDIAIYDENSINSSTDNSDFDRRRGRPKRPKRTLVSTWKKRLSTYTPSGPAIPTGRSASVHLQTDFERENHSKGVWKSISKFFVGPRSVSADRLAKPFTSNTVAGAKSFLAVPRSQRGSDDGSSMSELSGITTASAKTYITEESSLVIESVEKGVTKHYMIPFHIAEKGHLKTRGTKLHIYMDHIFVAKRVKSGTLCEVCSRRLPLSLGKQGYVCRDCALTCHKPCHVKVENHCEHTSLPAMELQLYDDGSK